MKHLYIVLILALAGCASGPRLLDYSLPVESVELAATPFFPQAEYQCGPAALAMVLGANGLAVTPDELTPQIYLPGRKGSLQAEIIAATRRHDRIPYILEGSLDDLLAEVAAGTPVLVMQNLGLRIFPQWHYAVLIGYDAPSDTLLLRSGTDERLRMNRIRFQGTWSRAGNWAMVAVLPENPPVTARINTWLRAASDFEELGQTPLAAMSYEAATRRWPEHPLPWQALANTSYALGDLHAAELALRRSLGLAESVAGYNNLAHILLKQGCPTAAAAVISRAEAMADAAPLGDILARTRFAIEAAGGDNADACRDDDAAIALNP